MAAPRQCHAVALDILCNRKDQRDHERQKDNYGEDNHISHKRILTMLHLIFVSDSQAVARDADNACNAVCPARPTPNRSGVLGTWRNRTDLQDLQSMMDYYVQGTCSRYEHKVQNTPEPFEHCLQELAHVFRNADNEICPLYSTLCHGVEPDI